MQTTPHDSPGTLVSLRKRLHEIPIGSPPTGVPDADELGKIVFSTGREVCG